MQQSRVLETWVGIFVALGLVAVFFMAMQVSNLSDIDTDGKSFRVTARFSNAGSLKVQAPVSMAGVRLGRVKAIHFDKDSYEAIVEMSIDSGYDTLPDDTTATILTQGLLGAQYVGLTPGGSSEYLKEGDELELTQSAMVLEEVISRFLFNKAEGGTDQSDAEGTSGRDEKESQDMKAAEPLLKSEGDGDEPVADEAAEKKDTTQPKPSARPKVAAKPQAPAQTAHQSPVRKASPTPGPVKKAPASENRKAQGSEAPK